MVGFIIHKQHSFLDVGSWFMTDFSPPTPSRIKVQLLPEEGRWSHEEENQISGAKLLRRRRGGNITKGAKILILFSTPNDESLRFDIQLKLFHTRLHPGVFTNQDPTLTLRIHNRTKLNAITARSSSHYI